MARERIERHETHEEWVEPATERVAPRRQVVRQTHTSESHEVDETRPRDTVNVSGGQADHQVTNVNATTDSASGNVSISTPDGTQININSMTGLTQSLLGVQFASTLGLRKSCQ